MRVSVVISTLNRAEGLRNTLHSLRLQRYEDFEVVVVNGPSVDDTESVLDEMAFAIKRRRCAYPNLSMSRNVGIRAAAGELVAFIDDDALPEPDWLEAIVPHFSDDAVGGVGGIVFDNSGVDLQYRFSASNRFGGTKFSEVPFDDRSFPGSWEFPYLQGTNCVFRRSALEEIGFFDEEFEYYLDETDVACRVVDRGYVIRQLNNAGVHHKFLPSDVRNEHRVVRNWYPVIKNRIYFGFKHALDLRTVPELLADNLEFMAQCRQDVWFHEQAGRLPRGTHIEAKARMDEAVTVGLRRGLAGAAQQRIDPQSLTPDSEFKPFAQRTARRDGLMIVMVSQDYPPAQSGGIATLTANAAAGLSARGHEVRVIAHTDQNPTVDLVGEVWLHRVSRATDLGNLSEPPLATHIQARNVAVSTEIQRISGYREIDVVYGPIWDVEASNVLQDTPLPVVTHVETTMAISCRVREDWANNEGFQKLVARPLISAEGLLLEGSTAIHAISSAIASAVIDDYHLSRQERVAVIPLAIALPDDIVDRELVGQRVLFVGRLEPRKGIDTLLDIAPDLLDQFPNAVIDIAGNDQIPLGNGSTYRQQFELRHPEIDAGRLRFHGVVDDDELDRLYRECDIFVAPSRYESFGLVYLEAMRFGKPVIGTRTGGVPEIIRDGIDGLLVEPNDAGDLRRALCELLGSQDRREQLGLAGRRRVLSDFTISGHSEKLETLLARVRSLGPTDIGDLDMAVDLNASGGLEIVVTDTTSRTLIVAGPRSSVVRVAGAETYLAHLSREGINRIALPRSFDAPQQLRIFADTPVKFLGMHWLRPVDTE